MPGSTCPAAFTAVAENSARSVAVYHPPGSADLTLAADRFYSGQVTPGTGNFPIATIPDISVYQTLVRCDVCDATCRGKLPPLVRYGRPHANPTLSRATK